MLAVCRPQGIHATPLPACNLVGNRPEVGPELLIRPVPASFSNTLELGRVLYTTYAYPLELAAMLLLVAIVAAISLTMRRRAGLKYQDISRQVAVRPGDRLRIVKMEAEKGP